MDASLLLAAHDTFVISDIGSSTKLVSDLMDFMTSRNLIVIVVLLLLMFSSVAESRKTPRMGQHQHQQVVDEQRQLLEQLEETTRTTTTTTTTTLLPVQNFPHRSNANSFNQETRYTQPTPSGPNRGHNSMPTP
ncbi:unnamed protein product [Sphagnum troendelagicum]|uniref:Uncharacterized protein n=1 Tax=Sphagnum troendelagicum TaxID=128251 RepID=A0ABP0UES5_9BRYO